MSRPGPGPSGELRLADPAEGLEFAAEVGGVRFTIDSRPGQEAPSPVHLQIVALAGCMAMDVISILRKKRLEVTAYRVRFHSERAADPPRRFTAITLVHEVRGHRVPAAAVAEAVRLSEDRYCSVRHSLRPDLVVSNVIEIVAAD